MAEVVDPLALVPPTFMLLAANVFGPHPASVYRIRFTGTYPAGGLDLTPDLVMTGGVFFALIADTAQYRFAFDIPSRKLRVFVPGGAEASGAITVDTRGLFIGTAR